MALSPLYVGETHPTWSLTWLVDGGSALNITGATLTGVLQNVKGGTDVTLAGTFTITSGSAGTFTYAPVAADLATAGSYQLQIKAVFGDSTVEYSDPVPVQILAVL